MQTNFAFISTEFPEIFAEAIEAEKFVYIQPRFSALQSRIALEKAIFWLYENDDSLYLPYDTSLGALMHSYEFKTLIPHNMFVELNIVRKIGNKGAHGDRVKADEALSSLKNTFRFISWISKFYSEENPDILPFDITLIPTGKEEDKTKKELQKLAEETEKARQQQEKQLRRQKELEAENAELQEKIKNQEKLLAERKAKREEQYRDQIVVPPLTSEHETRKQLIDLMLFEAGWKTLREGVELEYEVTGMPKTTNPSGKGYVDYVLWGDNGKPLAVVEAKSTLHDASKGKHQAFLYADCLEKMTGHRPVIFYSNGYETYIWDDYFYPPRLVYGFYTKEELDTLIYRRGRYENLRKYKVNTEIAGRPYQLQAIQAISEAFVGETKNGITGRHRKALLVMATGSGKTRTSAAIVEMLTKCNWAKRVLFLADRNALVNQAKNSFKEHLPNLSAIDLTKEKNDNTARLVFSTYPTMMNLIDDTKADGEKLFNIGHFDLIIIDEAHRSVYMKYQAIFDYFDSLLIGLTATPIKHMDRNTYSLFDLEEDNPTFAYELEQAVKDEFLVPPVAIDVPLKFPREGIKYDDLSERDKRKYEEAYGIGGSKESEEPQGGETGIFTPKSEINQFLFNNDTVDRVLDLLFEQGLKIESGDKIGKTIIFAKNHNHAVFIAKRFYENYPELGGDFLEVIDNYNDKAQDLLERFKYDKGEDKMPQIAVSVDMMDTGVDAPRVLNLVFFKEVKSASKFWQMIGRGTRLSPDIFGPGEDKTNFYIFDICGNFEFFNEHPDGKPSRTRRSLSELIFDAQLAVVNLINLHPESTEEEQELAKIYKEELYTKVKNLDEKRFIVRKALKYVRKYKNHEEWDILTDAKLDEMSIHLSKLVLFPEEDDELAKRFDLLIYRLEMATIEGFTSKKSEFINEIYHIGRRLLDKTNIPSVKLMEKVLLDTQNPIFWETISLKRMELLRTQVRDLIQYLKSEKREPIYSDIYDELDLGKVGEIEIRGFGENLKNYKARIEHFIKEHKDHLVIDKIYRNLPISSEELKSLEEFLTHEKFDLSEIEKEYETKSLGVFVRKILGLDIGAAQHHFADFIQEENLNNNQIQFINKIIDYLNVNGVMDRTKLSEEPFTSMSDSGVFGIFEDMGKVQKVVNLIEKLEDNLRGA